LTAKQPNHSPRDDGQGAGMPKQRGFFPLEFSDFEQASMFMLHAVKAIPGLQSQDHRFTVVQLLAEAALAFPAVPRVIEQNA